MKKTIKRLLCKHDFKPIRNIYGFETILYDARSVWKCPKCEKLKFEDFLISNSMIRDEKLKQILIKHA
jgi:hypothetical protein